MKKHTVFHISLPPESSDLLHRLKDSMQLPSWASTITQALRALEEKESQRAKMLK
jgi:hypothetical protein